MQRQVLVPGIELRGDDRPSTVLSNRLEIQHLTGNVTDDLCGQEIAQEEDRVVMQLL